MSHTLPETWERDGGVRRALDVVQKVTGTRPETCPWRALYDPLVAQVLTLHASWDDGNLAVFLGDDDPAIVHDALMAYRLAVVATRAEQDKRRRARAKSQKPPPR